MERFAFLILGLYLLNSVYSQDFDLNSYKFRHQFYEGATISFSLNGDNRGTFNNNSRRGNQSDINSSFGQSAFYNRFSFQNTESIQRTMNSFVQTGVRYVGDRSRYNDPPPGYENELERNLGTDVTLSFDLTQREYEGNDFKFFALECHASYNYSRHLSIISSGTFSAKNEFLSNYLNNTNTGSLRTSFDLGSGRGRIENITDAVSALFIAEDLGEKLGVQLDSMQIQKLAEAITRIRNQRYFDFRYRYIEQIIELDKALKELGVDESGPNYFATINDNWLYANRLTRSAGDRLTSFGRLQFNILPAYSSAFSFSQVSAESYQKTMSFIGLADLSKWWNVERVRNINHKAQTSTGFDIGVGTKLFGWGSNEVTSSEPILTPPSLLNGDVETVFILYTEARLPLEFIYQPNSRNFFRADFNPSIGFQIDNSENLNTLIGAFWGVDYFRFVNERLSYEFKLSGNVGNNVYSNVLNITFMNSALSFSARIAYAFF